MLKFYTYIIFFLFSTLTYADKLIDKSYLNNGSLVLSALIKDECNNISDSELLSSGIIDKVEQMNDLIFLNRMPDNLSDSKYCLINRKQLIDMEYDIAFNSKLLDISTEGEYISYFFRSNCYDLSKLDFVDSLIIGNNDFDRELLYSSENQNDYCIIFKKKN